MNTNTIFSNHIRRVADAELGTDHKTRIFDADQLQQDALYIRPRACEAVIEAI